MFKSLKIRGRHLIAVGLIIAFGAMGAFLAGADPALTFRPVKCGIDSIPTTAIKGQPTDNVNTCHLVGEDPTTVSTNLIIENQAFGGVKWTLASLGGSSAGVGLFQIFNPAATCDAPPIHGCPALSIDSDQNVALGQPFPRAKLDISNGTLSTDILIENRSGDGSKWVLSVLGGGTSLGSGLRIFNPDANCSPIAIHGCPAISIDPEQNVGIGTPFPTQKLHVEGNLFVNGSITKTGGGEFVTQNDPNDGSREIVYATPIGGEVGTYLRGSAQLLKGEAVINLPEHFDLVTSEEGLTVQLTAEGEWLQLYVVQKSTKQIVVREASGKSGQFDYLIQGIRKGYENHQVIQDK